MVKNPSFQDEHFVVLVAFVAGDDDAFALLQAFQHLVVLGVLTSDADLAAVCFLAVLVEDENPVAARHLEERSFRDEDALGRFAQLQIDIIRLSAADIFGAVAFEDKVGAETSFAHFGVDFAHLEAERCSLPFEGGWQPVGDAVDVVLVYHRFNLEVGKVVDLAYHLSGSDILSQFHIQQSQFSVYRGTHFQLVLALADEEDVLAHVVQVVFHLVHLMVR